MRLGVIVCGLWACALLGNVSRAGAETFTNADPRFTFKIPQGLVPITSSGIATFATNDPAERLPDWGVSLRLLKQKSPPGMTAPPPDLPSGTTIQSVQWRGMELQAFAYVTQSPKGPLAFRFVEIPLSGHPIAVVLVAQPGKAGNIDQLLQTSLDGLDGESNWTPITSSDRTALWVVGSVCVAAIAVMYALVWRSMRKRRARALQLKTVIPPMSPDRQRGRAIANAIIGAVTAFLAVFAFGLFHRAMGPPIVEHVMERDFDAALGAGKLSGAVGIAVMGISLVVLKRRADRQREAIRRAAATAPAQAPIAVSAPDFEIVE